MSEKVKSGLWTAEQEAMYVELSNPKKGVAGYSVAASWAFSSPPSKNPPPGAPPVPGSCGR